MNDLIAIGRNYDIIYVICAGHFEICPIVSIVGWQNKSTIDKKPDIAEEEEVKDCICIYKNNAYFYQKINALFCGILLVQVFCKTHVVAKNIYYYKK